MRDVGGLLLDCRSLGQRRAGLSSEPSQPHANSSVEPSLDHAPPDATSLSGSRPMPHSRTTRDPDLLNTSGLGHVGLQAHPRQDQNPASLHARVSQTNLRPSDSRPPLPWDGGTPAKRAESHELLISPIKQRMRMTVDVVTVKVVDHNKA